MRLQITYLDPETRYTQAKTRVRELRIRRMELDQEIVAAEAVVDIERERATPTSGEELMTVAAAAKRISVSESMIWKAVRAGKLDVTRVGRNTRISPTQLQAFVEAAR